MNRYQLGKMGRKTKFKEKDVRAKASMARGRTEYLRKSRETNVRSKAARVNCWVQGTQARVWDSVVET